MMAQLAGLDCLAGAGSRVADSVPRPEAGFHFHCHGAVFGLILQHAGEGLDVAPVGVGIPPVAGLDDLVDQRESHGIGEVALYDLMPGSSAGGG
jgi:hypothetical protein